MSNVVFCSEFPKLKSSSNLMETLSALLTAIHRTAIPFHRKHRPISTFLIRTPRHGIIYEITEYGIRNAKKYRETESRFMDTFATYRDGKSLNFKIVRVSALRSIDRVVSLKVWQTAFVRKIIPSATILCWSCKHDRWIQRAGHVYFIFLVRKIPLQAA